MESTFHVVKETDREGGDARGWRAHWDANCIRHINSTGLACKKSLTLATDTPDQCRCRVKQWLLMGTRVSSGHLQGRKKHVTDIKRHMIHVLDEAELDAEAGALHRIRSDLRCSPGSSR